MEVAKRSTHNCLIRSDEGLTLETSAFEFLYGGQFTICSPPPNPIQRRIILEVTSVSRFRVLVQWADSAIKTKRFIFAPVIPYRNYYIITKYFRWQYKAPWLQNARYVLILGLQEFNHSFSLMEVIFITNWTTETCCFFFLLLLCKCCFTIRLPIYELFVIQHSNVHVRDWSFIGQRRLKLKVHWIKITCCCFILRGPGPSLLRPGTQWRIRSPHAQSSWCVQNDRDY